MDQCLLQKLQVSLVWIFSRYCYFILFIITLGKKLCILLILCLSVIEKTHFSAPVAKMVKQWSKNEVLFGVFDYKKLIFTEKQLDIRCSCLMLIPNIKFFFRENELFVVKISKYDLFFVPFSGHFATGAEKWVFSITLRNKIKRIHNFFPRVMMNKIK